MDVIKHIKDLMNERGWTNYRIDKEAGLSQSTINKPFQPQQCPDHTDPGGRMPGIRYYFIAIFLRGKYPHRTNRGAAHLVRRMEHPK